MTIINNSANLAGLTSPDLYVQILTPPSFVRGVPSDVIGLVGTASWGPVNTPVHMGSGQDATIAWGAMSAASLTDPYDLSTDLYIAFNQSSQGVNLEAWGVRVTDGTDTAASAYLTSSTSASTETATITGTVAANDIITLTFTSASITGSPVHIAHTCSGTDTLTTLAAALAAGINANTALAAAQVTATSALGVVSINYPASLTVSFSETVSPGAETVTLAAGSSTANGIKLTAAYTGVLGAQMAAVVTAGSIANTFNVTISMPPLGQSEIFANIPSATFWTSLYTAITMGQNAARGPSHLVKASAVIPGVGAPSTGTTTLSGGSDGRTGVTTATLLGSASAFPATGLFALSNVNPAVGIAWIVGLTDTAAPSTMLTFGQTSAAAMLFSLKSGLSTTAKVSAVQTIGINDASWTYTGDWIYFFDVINNVIRLVPSTAFLGGMWATLSPAQSPLNSPVNVVVGTERNNPYTGTIPYSESEIGQLQQAGILNIGNPIPAGSQFGCRTGASTSNNAATQPVEWWRMTAFLARSINASLGGFVGQLQSQQANDPLRNSVKSALQNFMTQLEDDGLIDSSIVSCQFSTSSSAKPGMGMNTPASVAAHYLYALTRVTYLSSVWFFITQLQGGTTVNTSVQSAGNVTPPS